MNYVLVYQNFYDARTQIGFETIRISKTLNYGYLDSHHTPAILSLLPYDLPNLLQYK